MPPSSPPSGRPYRSHLLPACRSCRRRKSRCQWEAGATACVLCRTHKTECFTEGGARSNRASRPLVGIRSDAESPQAATATAADRLEPASPSFSQTPGNSAGIASASVSTAGISELLWAAQQTSHSQQAGHWARPVPPQGQQQTTWQQPPVVQTPLSAGDAEQETLHVVGPVNTSDSQILTNYLACMGNVQSGRRMWRNMSSGSNFGLNSIASRPVLFTSVRKRPVGTDGRHNPSEDKLHAIERLIEPYAAQLTELYTSKTNACLPLLDMQSFRAQYLSARDDISPALLACLYANSMVHWCHDADLNQRRQPDIRQVWNLANEALYSELHLFPGMSTITAMLLNIGGRPVTSMLGNGVQLGAAVSLAHSLGLNRSPLSWDIPDAEKLLRMKIWWSLQLHDRWSSLSYGTPPHIQSSQCDVPEPVTSLLFSGGAVDAYTGPEARATSVFIALADLTKVLDSFLRHIYRLEQDEPKKSATTDALELSLNQWTEALDCPDVRRVVIRGINLDMPGAANLRLCYLSVLLLLRRLELEEARSQVVPEITTTAIATTTAIGNTTPSMTGTLRNRYTQVRRAAEDIVMFAQELGDYQLQDFWLPQCAFLLQSTATCLLRCALETETSQAGLAQNGSLRLASDLLAVLRQLKETKAWDLGDSCLAQYEDILTDLKAPLSASAATSGGTLADCAAARLPPDGHTMHDGVLAINELYTSLWEPFPLNFS